MATKIYIDQGHNPVNPNAGAEGNGHREQDIVFRIGLSLAECLRENGFDVRLSRPTATTQLGSSNASSLQARVRAANDWNADYFISLHTNASSAASANGSEALVFASPSRAASLAARILQGLHRTTGLRTRGVKVRSGLYVLRYTRMPAVLVELGFISNPSEAAMMADRPDLFAAGICEGIRAYLGAD